MSDPAIDGKLDKKLDMQRTQSEGMRHPVAAGKVQRFAVTRTASAPPATADHLEHL